MPAEAKLSLPGLALAYAISAGIVFTGTDGLTSTTFRTRNSLANGKTVGEEVSWRCFARWRDPHRAACLHSSYLRPLRPRTAFGQFDCNSRVALPISSTGITPRRARLLSAMATASSGTDC